MNETDRENVKAAFNDPAAAVRVLIATDAASEGLNLHRTAHRRAWWAVGLKQPAPMSKSAAAASNWGTRSESAKSPMPVLEKAADEYFVLLIIHKALSG